MSEKLCKDQKKKVKEQIVLPESSIGHVMEINGKKYRLERFKKGKDPHTGQIVYTPVNEIEYEKRIKIVAKYIKKKVKDLTVEQIVAEALRMMPLNEFTAIEKKVKKKVIPKVRSGCLAIDMGGKDFVQIL